MANLFQKKRIYADWAATTPLHSRVKREMRRSSSVWANPSAIHKEGVEAKRALEAYRQRAARLLSAKPDELYFTSGGTEANNTILQGALRARLEEGVKPQDIHVVSTSIEHSSILGVLKEFERRGVRVTYVPPGSDGIVRADDMLATISEDTILVTCMYANNEIGTIQPVSKIGSGIRRIRADKSGRFPAFHIDASQAPLWLACDLEGLRADAVTLDAHKMQGPKGVGLLAVRRGTAFEPLMAGGGQERGGRPTTESVELIAGFVAALEESYEGREKRVRAAEAAQEHFISLIRSEIPAAVINGSLEKRVPNNVNISVPGIEDPELAVLKLDRAGIACSTKSSCLKGEEESYVVRSMTGVSPAESWRARRTLRFSFDPFISKGEVRRIVEALKSAL